MSSQGITLRETAKGKDILTRKRRKHRWLKKKRKLSSRFIGNFFRNSMAGGRGRTGWGWEKDGQEAEHESEKDELMDITRGITAWLDSLLFSQTLDHKGLIYWVIKWEEKRSLGWKHYQEKRRAKVNFTGKELEAQVPEEISVYFFGWDSICQSMSPDK